MKRAFVDANVILRYLTRDPPEMAEAALRTFTAAQRGKVRSPRPSPSLCTPTDSK